jgi:hypothetical protein
VPAEAISNGVAHRDRERPNVSTRPKNTTQRWTANGPCTAGVSESAHFWPKYGLGLRFHEQRAWTSYLVGHFACLELYAS